MPPSGISSRHPPLLIQSTADPAYPQTVRFTDRASARRASVVECGCSSAASPAGHRWGPLALGGADGTDAEGNVHATYNIQGQRRCGNRPSARRTSGGAAKVPAGILPRDHDDVRFVCHGFFCGDGRDEQPQPHPQTNTHRTTSNHVVRCGLSRWNVCFHSSVLLRLSVGRTDRARKRL